MSKQSRRSRNPFEGTWTYRSLTNDPDVMTDFDDLEFGRGVLEIHEDLEEVLSGTLGGPGWELELHGSRDYGTPMQARFQGKGVVEGEEWIYDYICWLVPVWPNSTPELQRPALVGSVVRTVPHSSGSDGEEAPAGVVASFYAVKEEEN